MNRLLFLLIFGITGAAILLALGNWQLQRLAWKEDILARMELRIDETPVPLPDHPDPAGDDYLAVTAKGTILPGELFVLTSMRDAGAGFRVIVPFLMEDGRRVMIDRGFLPEAQRDEVRTLGPVTVTGNLRWPRETDSFTPAPDEGANMWFARDVPLMARALGTEPVLIVASSPTGPGIEPMPVDTAAIPNDHLQYAITWFSLAAIWVLMTAYFLWRTRARQDGKDG